MNHIQPRNAVLMPSKPHRKNDAQTRTITEGKPEYTLHQIANMSSAKLIVSVYRSIVFDLTDFEGRHPGGHCIIRSLSGADIQRELEQAHFFNLPLVTRGMQRYVIGKVQEISLPEEKQATYDHWCKILFLMPQVQNNLSNIWYFEKEFVGDRARFVPFQFVMNTLNILYGESGYLDHYLNL